MKTTAYQVKKTGNGWSVVDKNISNLYSLKLLSVISLRLL